MDNKTHQSVNIGSPMGTKNNYHLESCNGLQPDCCSQKLLGLILGSWRKQAHRTHLETKAKICKNCTHVRRTWGTSGSLRWLSFDWRPWLVRIPKLDPEFSHVLTELVSVGDNYPSELSGDFFQTCVCFPRVWSLTCGNSWITLRKGPKLVL